MCRGGVAAAVKNRGASPQPQTRGQGARRCGWDVEDGLSITWRAAAAGLEAAMALCAALNLAYFLHRAVSVEPLSRRAAAFVLALISFGAMVESGFVLIALGVSTGDSVFASAAWVLVRLATFAGTACISALVLRAMGDGK